MISGMEGRAVLLEGRVRLGGRIGSDLLGGEGWFQVERKEEEMLLSLGRGRGGECKWLLCSQGALSHGWQRCWKEELRASFIGGWKLLGALWIQIHRRENCC